jgi:DNA polymerase IV
MGLSVPINQNNLKADPSRVVMFVDMNSYFASCEQQVNYWLRDRPVVVCVYTGKFGCVIAPSIEAKRRGVKMGMRLNEAHAVCPDIIPLPTNPSLYREIHVKIMNLLRRYCPDVIPKSIDEALVNISDYSLVYKDPIKLAKQIKEDIKNEIGDYLTCSIGLGPNAFLAKLGTEIQKPNGLVWITHENIDSYLSKMKLTDLPGIADAMAERLRRAGILTPLELRHASAQHIHRACKSIIGEHWHHRLNFSEVDIATRDYQAMQAMRQISKAQRRYPKVLDDLFQTLCMTLERRMVKMEYFCNEIDFFATYEDGYSWKTKIHTAKPVQDGIEVMELIKVRMRKMEKDNPNTQIINSNLTAMGVTVTGFIPHELVQIELFENNIRKNTLRKVVYEIKDKYGRDKVMKAAEMQDEEVLKDVIGFGSVKDLYDGKMRASLLENDTSHWTPEY